jgi:hypothetical protein
LNYHGLKGVAPAVMVKFPGVRRALEGIGFKHVRVGIMVIDWVSESMPSIVITRGSTAGRFIMKSYSMWKAFKRRTRSFPSDDEMFEIRCMTS